MKIHMQMFNTYEISPVICDMWLEIPYKWGSITVVIIKLVSRIYI